MDLKENLRGGGSGGHSVGVFHKKTGQLVIRNGHFVPFYGSHFVRRKRKQQLHQLKKNDNVREQFSMSSMSLRCTFFN